jgi:hypothetical protein
MAAWNGWVASRGFNPSWWLLRRVIFGKLFYIQFCKRMNRHNF